MNSCRPCCGSHTPYPVGRRIASLIPLAHIVSLLLSVGVLVANENNTNNTTNNNNKKKKKNNNNTKNNHQDE